MAHLRKFDSTVKFSISFLPVSPFILFQFSSLLPFVSEFPYQCLPRIPPPVSSSAFHIFVSSFFSSECPVPLPKGQKAKKRQKAFFGRMAVIWKTFENFNPVFHQYFLNKRTTFFFQKVIFTIVIFLKIIFYYKSTINKRILKTSAFYK